MKRLSLFAMLVALLAAFGSLGAADKAADKEKKAALEALKQLNDFVGSFKGAGPTWTEKVAWGWKFKGDDRWLHVDIEKGKHFKSGDLRYLPEKKKFQLVMKTADDKEKTYEGIFKDEKLTVEFTDPEAKKVTERLVMNTVDEGARFIYRLDKKKGTIFTKDFEVAGGKEGESFAGGGKKNICCVTGGLGTMAVQYKGKTYYVCCSGCRDAFNDNPEKIIKEFEASKK
jgi:hypothetical protein